MAWTYKRVEGDVSSVSPSSERSMTKYDEGLTLETSALYSLRWSIYIFNLVDTTKLNCLVNSWSLGRSSAFHRELNLSVYLFDLRFVKNVVFLEHTHSEWHDLELNSQFLYLESSRSVSAYIWACGTMHIDYQTFHITTISKRWQ